MRYELWALGNDKNGEATNYEELLFECEQTSNVSPNKEDYVAENVARSITEKLQSGVITLTNVPNDVKFIEMRLELVEDNSIETTCVEILYSEEFEYRRQKVYVLSHCAAEANYTPSVYNSSKDAEDALGKTVYGLTHGEDGSEVDVESAEVYDLSAEVVYPDDTYDKLDINEVEVQ